MKLAPAIALAVAVAGCSYFQPEPQTIVRVDTLVLTVEVTPPLPQGDSVEICLSTGVPVHVRISATGDTMVGAARVSLAALRPAVAFAGAYATGQPWFEQADTIRFEKRLYRKGGVPVRRACDELKSVGSYQGVPVFADVTAPQALPSILVPVRPGSFQNYHTPTSPRRR